MSCAICAWRKLIILSLYRESLWIIYSPYSGNGVLEDQEVPFCRLEHDLIVVVYLEGPGDWRDGRSAERVALHND